MAAIGVEGAGAGGAHACARRQCARGKPSVGRTGAWTLMMTQGRLGGGAEATKAPLDNSSKTSASGRKNSGEAG